MFNVRKRTIIEQKAILITFLQNLDDCLFKITATLIVGNPTNFFFSKILVLFSIFRVRNSILKHEYSLSMSFIRLGGYREFFLLY